MGCFFIVPIFSFCDHITNYMGTIFRFWVHFYVKFSLIF